MGSVVQKYKFDYPYVLSLFAEMFCSTERY